MIDLGAIIRRLDTLPWSVHLSVEDHGGSFTLPIRDEEFLSRFPDLTHSELESILGLAGESEARPACRPVERTDWPALCEARLTHDLEALRALAEAAPAAEECPRV